MIDRTFLILDLSLDVVDGVAALDLEGDGLPRQGLDEDLHLAGRVVCVRERWSRWEWRMAVVRGALL